MRHKKIRGFTAASLYFDNTGYSGGDLWVTFKEFKLNDPAQIFPVPFWGCHPQKPRPIV